MGGIPPTSKTALLLNLGLRVSYFDAGARALILRKRQRGFPKAKVDRQGSAKLAARANHFQLPPQKQNR